MNIRFNKPHLIGLILSLTFTIIPFYVTKYNAFNKKILLFIIVSCAIIQICVHLIYFLNLSEISNQKWNIISLIFTIFVLIMLVFGSVWIMTHLHHNLMV